MQGHSRDPTRVARARPLPAARPCTGPLRPTLLGAVLLAAALLAAREAQAQNLGHKLPGAVGIDAGVQPEPGLYLLDQFVFYGASRLRDRDGELVPIQDLEVDVIAAALGAAFTLKPRNAPYLSFAFALPLAEVSLSVEDPRVAVDRGGLGDVFVKPLMVGSRLGRFDVVAAYAFYAPTGRFEPRGAGSGIGRGFWTHQLSAGGAYFASRERQVRASALVSYDYNLPKRGIDVRRGNTLQIQGGAGVRLQGRVDVGLAGFALWQVTDDSGADVPPALRGARDRVYGLGPEVNVLVPELRLRLGLRAEWEFGARSRPDGRIFVATLAVPLWRPEPQRPPQPAQER